MPLLQAKCTNCGADLKVDGSKDAAICPYCGSAYIVEKTIANFYCSSVGSINASVVNIYGHEPKKLTSANTEKKTEVPEAKLMQPSQEFLQRLAVVTSFRRAVQYNLLLKSDGTLGLTQFGNFGIPTGEPWLINYRIFQWKNIKSFDVVVCTKVDIEEPYVYALTFDGRCYADTRYIQDKRGVIPQKTIDSFETVRSWSDIVQISRCDKGFVGLKRDGSVISTWNDQELATWKNVKKLALPGALTKDGRVLAYGVKDYEKKAYSQWTDIVDIAGGSNELRGLTKTGMLIQPSINEPAQIVYKGLFSLEHPDLNPDGSFHLFGTINTTVWGSIERLGKGYIASAHPYYLSQNGRVDMILGDEIVRETAKDVVALICQIGGGYWSRELFLRTDGKLYDPRNQVLPRQLLVGDPADYGRKLSAHVPDTLTKERLVTSYNALISRYEGIKKSRGLFGKKSDLNEKIEFCKGCLREIDK